MSDQNVAREDRAPGWEMSPYFPEMDGGAYRAFRHTLDADVQALLQHVGRLERIEHEQLPVWIDLLQKLEEITARTGHSLPISAVWVLQTRETKRFNARPLLRKPPARN